MLAFLGATTAAGEKNQFSCKVEFDRNFIAAPTAGKCNNITTKLNGILSSCPFDSGILGCIPGETAEDPAVIGQVSGKRERESERVCVCARMRLMCVYVCLQHRLWH